MIVSIGLSLAATFFVAGCAETEANNTKSLLASAGFRVRKPETDKQKEVYAALTNQRVERATVNGRVFYVFKDEEDGIAYVGHEPEYQRYKDLCVQQRIAADYYAYASMDSYYSTRWYGAWGYRGMYW